MGWFGKQKQEYQDTNYYYKLGCEILGKPQGNHGFGGPLERLERINAGKKEAARRASQNHYPEPSRPNGYYSQMRESGENSPVEYFIGPNGDITAERPHVHVIFNPHEQRVIFQVTHSDGTHGQTEYLPIDASGSDVNSVQHRLCRQLH